MNRKTITAALVALLHSAGLAVASPTEGEIRKIDDAAGKVTVRHGPMENSAWTP